MSIVCYAVPQREFSYSRGCFTEDGNGSMRNGNILFSDDHSCAESADWLFVAESAYDNFYTRIPRERRVLFLMEPPVMHKYALSYLEQFGCLVSPFKIDPRYTGRIITGNPCLGWFAGVGIGGDKNSERVFRTLAEVKEYPAKNKSREISIVSSSKAKFPGHKKRLLFLDALRSEFGKRVDYFGRGFASVDDKLIAIEPYKYHIAIENSCFENYWTEKLTDAWIGRSLPIYCGDPSIKKQIPDPDGLEFIDIDDISSALAKIRKILDYDVFDSRIDAIEKCRKWVIDESNPCEKMCRIIDSSDEVVRMIPKLAERELIRVRTRGRTAFAIDLIGTVFGRNTANKALSYYVKKRK